MSSKEELFSQVLLRVGRTDKDTAHSYGAMYDMWFAGLQNRPVNVLEVGVCVYGGGGVLSLAEYFKNGRVWGVDVDRTLCDRDVFSHPRVNFIECDAYGPDLLKSLGDTRFDIIIDDALHDLTRQSQLLKTLSPRLTETGFYIVEDVCTSHWLPYLNEFWDAGLRHTLVDMSTPTCYDNVLIRFDRRW
jgi:cephalosporin hydroxylase